MPRWSLRPARSGERSGDRPSDRPGDRPGDRRRLFLALLVLLALVLAGGLVVHRRLDRSPLDRALGLVPAGTLRLSFTDWKQVRAELQPQGLVSTAEVQEFIAKGYDRDLTAASSIDDSAAALHRKYGFSPTNADWEAYAQSRQGAVMVLQLPGATDMKRIEGNLAKLGYQRPASDTGVWNGGVDLVSRIDPTISPELQYVVVDAGRHLVLSSDTRSYAATAQRVVAGKDDSLESMRSLAGKVPDPAGAFLWRGDFACDDLSLTEAAPDDRRAAQRLIDKAGGVNPLTGLVMGMRADRTVDVALGFADQEQAKKNLRPRARLLVGEAVGRGISYSDDFRLIRSRTDGSAVVLTMKSRTRTGFALSQMNSGPVIFATC